MYPLDDKNLDRLSREAAEHFEVDPGASGWDHLEQRLNKELPQEKKRRRFLFWLFLITATTGGALTAILKYQPVTPLAKNVTGVITPADKTAPLPNNQSGGDTRTYNATQNQAISHNNETPPVRAERKAGKLPVASNPEPNASATNLKPGVSIPTHGNTQPAAATTEVTTPEKISTQPVEKTTTRKGVSSTRVRIQKAPVTLNYSTIAPDNNTGRLFSKPTKQKPGKRSGSTSNQNNQTIPTVPEINTPAPENRITNVDRNTIGKPVEMNNELATTQPTNATQTDSTQHKIVETPTTDSAKTMARQKKKDKIKQPLEFGVMAGPDMSAVAFGPLYKAGYNFGLQIGYRFSNRWSVNTGVIYTKKFYKTDSTQFNYKDNPWPSNKTLSRVEGNCSMWEIPVNVRYDFSYNNKRRWFASTGLSTYLMDKEDYEMYYRWNGSPTYSQPLVNDTTNSSYVFSIWNLSVGMERSLGKRFSLQAEPYLKIPLKDLGVGNMRMNSYGILFTLKYKPFLNSKRSDKNK